MDVAKNIIEGNTEDWGLEEWRLAAVVLAYAENDTTEQSTPPVLPDAGEGPG